MPATPTEKEDIYFGQRVGFIGSSVGLDPLTVLYGFEDDGKTPWIPASKFSVNHNPIFNAVDFEIDLQITVNFGQHQRHRLKWAVRDSDVECFYRDQPLNEIEDRMFRRSCDLIADDFMVFVTPPGLMPDMFGAASLDLTFARTETILV